MSNEPIRGWEVTVIIDFILIYSFQEKKNIPQVKGVAVSTSVSAEPVNEYTDPL